MTIKGLERVKYTKKDGGEVDAVRIHVQRNDANVVGVLCESVYMSTQRVSNLGCSFPEDKYKDFLGKTLEIEYDSRGYVSSMALPS